MKILLLSDTFGYGGAERHMADLARGLMANGMEVLLACVKPERPLLAEPAFAELAPVTETLGARSYLDLSAVEAMRRLVGRFQPDLVLTSNMYAMSYAWLTRRGRMPPLVAIFHGTVLRDSKERWKHRLLYQHIANRTDAFVYLCEFQANYWRERGLRPQRPLVIYNGIDLGRFHAGVVSAGRSAARRLLGVADSDYVIGCNAMLRPEKNHWQLLEAVANLRRKGLPAVAALLGEGPLRPQLEAQVRSLGIEPHVRFLGRQARVEDFMAGFDVGALPSVAVETFSLAALEQMAIGLPMVMSNQGGAAEMLTDGEHGFIVQTGDLSALTGALARLAAPELRLRQGRAAARNVVGRFGSSAMVKRYLALCHEVGAGRASTDAAASLVR